MTVRVTKNMQIACLVWPKKFYNDDIKKKKNNLSTKVWKELIIACIISVIWKAKNVIQIPGPLNH